MWVLDHLDDLESDFSVFHRVEDLYDLPAPRFFRLATRIFAYDGVMTARLHAEAQGGGPTPGRPRGAAASPGRADDRQVHLAQVQLAHPDLIEKVVTPRGC